MPGIEGSGILDKKYLINFIIIKNIEEEKWIMYCL